MFAKISKSFKLGLTPNAEKYHCCLLLVDIDNISVFISIVNFIFRDYICLQVAIFNIRLIFF